MRINKLIRKIVMVGVIATIGTSLIGCGGTTTNDNKKEEVTQQEKSTFDKEELVIGLDDTFVPMGFKDESGELVGFDVELAKAVGEKLGKKFKFQAIDWSMKETELNNGNIDLIWNGYSINDERKEKVEFSNPYLNNRQVIITLSNSNINSKKDLEGKKVGAQDQSSSVDAVRADSDIESKFDGGQLVTFETNNDALMDLEAGRLDAIVADEILARYYMKERGEDKYRVLEEDFGDEQYAVGIKKHDTEFVEQFNKALKQTIEDGTAGDISKKWFDKDIVIK